MQWDFSKGVQGESHVIRALFWRNHSDSRMALGGTVTGGLEVFAIVQLRQTECLSKSGNRRVEGGGWSETRGALFFPEWLHASRCPDGLSDRKYP